ncbi:MAG: PQQ-like beta-propeller repeat protein [Candidatus Nealsonbacteria bacterium]|nr:PQQ-like beta-propeller repeat protein [Candidatus Nealsonbacteria bacterium]
MKSIAIGVPVLLVLMAVAPAADGADWPQFRGPAGAATTDDAKVPLAWSDSKNVKWKIPLPGPGSSSPIVFADRVFVTCYSGYGVEASNPGSLAKLQRHLICVDRNSGKTLWSKTVDATLPEDELRGYLSQHGYASSTPVTDGKRVFVLFGKTGVMAFDFDGNKLWQKSVGTESSNRRWGSAASPILYKDMVIVNASEESQSIRAMKQETGEEVWRAEASSLELSYGTPLLVDLPGGRKELVLGVPYEVWGLDPDTGKLTWYAETALDGNIVPSPVASGGIVVIFGGYRNTGAVAVEAGGKGDVTKTRVLWTSKDASYVPSPVVRDGKLYWVSDMAIAFCAELETGKTIFSERLPRTGGGSFGGKPCYASVVRAGERFYSVSRTAGTFVWAVKDGYEQLAHNRLESDQSDFNGSPAIADGQIFLRSNRFLYCIESP